MDCEELGFDHGDCSDDCSDGMIESCTGECTSAMYHGDGVCDDEAATTGLHLNCEALWYDLGDCETVGECASHEDCRDPDSRAEPPVQAPRRADGVAATGAPSKYPLQLLQLLV